MQKATYVGLSVLLLGALSGCPAPNGSTDGPRTPAAKQAESNLSETGRAAAIALGPGKCDENATLRPFVVMWDATEQAEFAAQGQDALLAVRVQGCSLELLPTCRVPGEYRLRATAGGMNALDVRSNAELRATIPFAVARLSGKVQKDEALSLKYFVRGVKTATAPALYRSDLGPGCHGATHFVLNYAAGAFELSESAKRGAAGEANVMGAGGGGGVEQSSSSLFRGGDFNACKDGKEECAAPVRLRLLPIVEDRKEDAPPPPERKLALAKPQPGTVEQRLSRGQIANVLRTARPGVAQCKRAHGSSGELKIRTKFTIGADGVISQVEIQGDAAPALISCVEEVLYSIRFPASTQSMTISYPYVFPADR